MRRSPPVINWTRSCLAVDIQGDRVLIIRAERGRTGITWNEVSGAAGKEPVVASIPVRESFIRWLEAPLSSITKAVRVLPTVLDMQLPFALEDCVYEMMEPSSTGKGGTKALAVGARSENLESCLRTLSAAGFDPVCLDHEGLALWTQSLGELPPSGSRELRIVVNMAAERWALVIGRGSGFLAAHSMKAADTDQAHRLIRPHLATDGDNTPETPAHWILAGPEAAKAVAGKVAMDRLTAIAPGKTTLVKEPEAFLARALATRALLPGRLGCNLRKGSLEHAVVTGKKRSNSTKAALITLASGLALCAANVGARLSVAARESALDRHFMQLAETAAGYRIAARGEDALMIVRREIAERSEALSPFMAAFEPSLTLRLEAIAVTGGTHGLVYETMLLDRDEVLIRGSSPHWGSCDHLLGYLRSEGYRCQLDRGDASDDARIPFVIRTLSP